MGCNCSRNPKIKVIRAGSGAGITHAPEIEINHGLLHVENVLCSNFSGTFDKILQGKRPLKSVKILRIRF